MLSILLLVPGLEGVSPERQKVMIGGVTLSDTEWGKAKLKLKEVQKEVASASPSPLDISFLPRTLLC